MSLALMMVIGAGPSICARGMCEPVTVTCSSSAGGGSPSRAPERACTLRAGAAGRVADGLITTVAGSVNSGTNAVPSSRRLSASRALYLPLIPRVRAFSRLLPAVSTCTLACLANSIRALDSGCGAIEKSMPGPGACANAVAAANARMNMSSARERANNLSERFMASPEARGKRPRNSQDARVTYF
jgi:hypothetical protein